MDILDGMGESKLSAKVFLEVVSVLETDIRISWYIILSNK